MSTVYRIVGRNPRLAPVGTVRRVLHEQTHTGVLGNAFPVYLVRCVRVRRERARDRWVVRLRGRWVTFEEASPIPRYEP